MSIQEWLMSFFLIATIVGVIKLNKKIKAGEVNNNPLTSAEKVFTALAGLAIPLLAVNGIMYYSLRKKYPVKAKQANKIGWITLLIAVGLGVIVTILQIQ